MLGPKNLRALLSNEIVPLDGITIILQTSSDAFYHCIHTVINYATTYSTSPLLLQLYFPRFSPSKVIYDIIIGDTDTEILNRFNLYK